MATIAAEMMLHCVLDGSLSLNDLEIECRPYHKNYGCALHNLKGSRLSACERRCKVFFPRKEPWDAHSLLVTVSNFPLQSSCWELVRISDPSEIVSA